jgi:hypothetical protein
MTHPFWKKHNPSYAVLTFAVWGAAALVALVFGLLKDWLKA